MTVEIAPEVKYISAPRQALEQALQGFAGAIVVASHDPAFINALRPTHHLSWTLEGWYLEDAETPRP